jgi:hypothetical protein
MPQAIHEVTNFVTGQVTQTVIPWTAEELRARIADKRWERETGGFSIEGQRITTFRDEMPVWTERKLDANERIEAGDNAFVYQYKPKGGNAFATFIPLQVLRIHVLFKWYVNACFECEAALFARIHNGEDLDAVHAAVMSESSWPQREFSWSAPSE